MATGGSARCHAACPPAGAPAVRVDLAHRPPDRRRVVARVTRAGVRQHDSSTRAHCSASSESVALINVCAFAPTRPRRASRRRPAQMRAQPPAVVRQRRAWPSPRHNAPEISLHANAPSLRHHAVPDRRTRPPRATSPLRSGSHTDPPRPRPPAAGRRSTWSRRSKPAPRRNATPIGPRSASAMISATVAAAPGPARPTPRLGSNSASLKSGSSYMSRSTGGTGSGPSLASSHDRHFEHVFDYVPLRPHPSRAKPLLCKEKRPQPT